MEIIIKNETNYSYMLDTKEVIVAYAVSKYSLFPEYIDVYNYSWRHTY